MNHITAFHHKTGRVIRPQPKFGSHFRYMRGYRGAKKYPKIRGFEHGKGHSTSCMQPNFDCMQRMQSKNDLTRNLGYCESFNGPNMCIKVWQLSLGTRIHVGTLWGPCWGFWWGFSLCMRHPSLTRISEFCSDFNRWLLQTAFTERNPGSDV